MVSLPLICRGPGLSPGSLVRLPALLSVPVIVRVTLLALQLLPPTWVRVIVPLAVTLPAPADSCVVVAQVATYLGVEPSVIDPPIDDE